MNPDFRGIYRVYIKFYDTFNTTTQEETVLVLADSVVEAVDKAGEYAQMYIANDPDRRITVFDINGVVYEEALFVGIQNETEEEEFLPETGILGGELPEGWNRQ